MGTTRLRVYCIWFFACLGLALVCGAFTAVTYTQAVTESGRNALLCLLLLCLTCGAAVAALVSGLASLWHLLQRHPRARARTLALDGGPDSSPAACLRADHTARETYHALISGQPLPVVESPTIPLQDGEAIHGIYRVQYSRLYGQEIEYRQYQHIGGGVAARLTMGTVNAARNHAEAKRAHEQASVQWREIQFTDAWATNQRLIVQANGSLTEFWYGSIIALYPDRQHFTLTLELRDAEPVRIIGPDVATIAVLVQYFTTGASGLLAQPAFQDYRTPYASPGTEMENRP